MSRPTRENRGSVADVTLTIRLTKTESDALDALAVRRTEQLSAYGVHSVTKASIVRSLIQQAARAENLLPLGPSLPAPVALLPIPVPKED